MKTLVAAGADVNATADNGFSPLHVAVEGDNMEAVKYLMKKHANINSKG